MANRVSFGWLVLLCLVVALLAGCATVDPEPRSYWPADGWPTSPPEEQGMDSELLADMLATILEQGYDIDGVTVVRHGYIVLDATVILLNQVRSTSSSLVPKVSFQL